MGERQTGATDAQIEAALDRLMAQAGSYRAHQRSQDRGHMHRINTALVPPGHRIIEPEDVTAIERARDLIAAVHELDGYEDFSPFSDWTDGVCPVCQSGIEDASGLNGARRTLYELMSAIRDLGDEARLAALVDGATT